MKNSQKVKKLHKSLIIEPPDPNQPIEDMEIVEKQSQNSFSHQEISQENSQEKDDLYLNSSTTTTTSSSSSSSSIIQGPIFQQNFPFVVLDCANIGWSFGDSSFSALGLQIAYNYFEQFSLNVYGFIPSSFVRKKPIDGTRGNILMETDDWEIMNNLIKNRKMCVVPPGDHDDLYILNFAKNQNGFIISNDFYLDHLRSIESYEEQNQAKKWLDFYRCSYTFVPQYEGNYTIMLNPTRY